MSYELKRDVGLFSAILYGVGVILGAGVYALIGEAAGQAGNSLWLSFFLAAIVSTFTGLSYMELISMFPRSAAEYVYVKNAFKNDLLAFSVGWVEILTDIIATSAVALGFGGYFQELFGIPVMVSAILLIILFSLVNFLGIKESARINVVFSIAEILGLLFVVVTAVYFGRYGSVNYLEMPKGITGTLGAAALIFFAYIGFEDLANISEEVKDPRRNVPRALLASVIITTVIYVLVGTAVVSLVRWEDLAASRAPLAFAVSSLLGDQASWVMSIIALFATSNTVLIGLIVSSRMIYGMSKDGVLPEMLSKIHSKQRTPWISTIVTMIFSIAFVFFDQINIVASITDLGTFLIFILVNASAITLRYRMPDRKRAFKTPLNLNQFPLIPFFGLFSSALLLTYLSTEAILIGLLTILMGVGIYFMTSKIKGAKQG